MYNDVDYIRSEKVLCVVHLILVFTDKNVIDMMKFFRNVMF